MGQLSCQKIHRHRGEIFIVASGDTRVKTFCIYRWRRDDDSDLDTYEVDLDTCGRCRPKCSWPYRRFE
jgi:hypothetical protein